LPEEEGERRAEDEKQPHPQPWDHGFLLPVRIVLRDLAARGLPAPGSPVRGDTLWAFIEAELGETLKLDFVHFCFWRFGITYGRTGSDRLIITARSALYQ
jgi:hypothetical protein